MDSEEQQMEMEAIESLFPEEMKRVSDTEFKLAGLVPYSDNSRKNFVSVDLHLVYPAKYPSEEHVQISIEKATGGIEADTFKLTELSLVIQNVCDENSGACCVYQVADAVQEWLRGNNSDVKSLHDLMESRNGNENSDDEYDDSDDSDWEEDDDDEEEEDESFEGLLSKDLCPESERVTRAQFEQWKLGNDQVLMQQGLIKRISESDVRQTGKQQFLSTLRNRAEPNTTSITAELFVEDIELDDDEE